MKFSKSDFAVDLELLVPEFGTREVSHMLDIICPVDVADLGFILEDNGKLRDADQIFNLTVEELDQMLQAA